MIETSDGKADMQFVIEYPKENTGEVWPNGHYMIMRDLDKDNVFNYINWNDFSLRCWDRNGVCDFYEDYSGHTLFMKIHTSTYDIQDLRLNWENPFLFYDNDGDGILDSEDNFTLSQWAWCDLSELGEVEVISISMESTDVGEYGMNTAAYVCIDGLQADCTAATHTIQRDADRVFAAGKQLFMQLQKAQHITVCNIAGATVWAGQLAEGSHTLNLATLPTGIYIVRHNSGSTKIVL